MTPLRVGPLARLRSCHELLQIGVDHSMHQLFEGDGGMPAKPCARTRRVADEGRRIGWALKQCVHLDVVSPIKADMGKGDPCELRDGVG